MTKRVSLPLIWALAIALLLGSAYVIVGRNGAAAPGNTPAAYTH